MVIKPTDQEEIQKQIKALEKKLFGDDIDQLEAERKKKNDENIPLA